MSATNVTKCFELFKVNFPRLFLQNEKDYHLVALDTFSKLLTNFPTKLKLRTRMIMTTVKTVQKGTSNTSEKVVHETEF